MPISGFNAQKNNKFTTLKLSIQNWSQKHLSFKVLHTGLFKEAWRPPEHIKTLQAAFTRRFLYERSIFNDVNCWKK